MTHKKQFNGLLFLIITLSSYSSYLTGQDTIRPLFVVLPKSDSVSCSDQNVDLVLNRWYNTSAGAIATDNSGVVSIVANKTIMQFRNEFFIQFNNRCLKSRKVDLIFKAVDPSGNETNSATVSFKINDEAVRILKQPDLNIIKSCTIGIQDSLNNWIKGLGNGITVDGCGRAVIFKNFIYNTNLGGAGTGDILRGPYPIIPNNACTWTMDISFFVVDSCDNTRALTGRYRIRDDVPPIIDLVPNITVSCSNLPNNSINVTDACDKNPDVLYSFTSTKGIDSTRCNFYSYVVQRQWVVADKCGNSSTARQTMTVIDRDRPMIAFDTPKIITCEELKDTFRLINLLADNCAKPSLIFSDSIVGNGCAYSLFRKYTVKDFCGNETVRTQQLLVSDTKRPNITSTVQNLILNCSTPLDSIKVRFNEWVGRNGGLTAVDNCSSVRYNGLLKGRYLLQDSTTYRRARLNIDSILVNSKSSKSFALIDSIDFLASDLCGNTVISTAIFGISDTISPTFTQCIGSMMFDLVGGNCSKMVSIVSPKTSSSCLKNTTQIFYSLNQQTPRLISSDSLVVLLTDASNIISYLAIDQAGNESRCTTIIRLNDIQAPKVECSTDTIIYIANDACDASFIPLSALKISDNCSTPTKQDSTFPKTFIIFPIKPDNTGTRVDTSEYILNGLEKIRFSDKDVFLSITIKSKFILNKSSFSVMLSNGSIAIPKQTVLVKDSVCDQYTFIGTISKTTFNTLIGSGNMLKLRLLTSGMFPCSGLKSNNTDSVSTLQANLKTFDYQVNGTYQLNNESKKVYQLDSLLKLKVGKYKFEASTRDQSNNLGTCTQVVTVFDTIKPTVTCKSIPTLTSFKSDASSFISLLKTDSLVADNCEVDSTWVNLGIVNCQNGQRKMNVTFTAMDKSGNRSSCVSEVSILPPTLKLSYLTGLCGNDTLRLFHNISLTHLDSTVKFRWRLRDSIISFLPNPIFINASSLFGKVLTFDVITKDGCVYSSILEVMSNSSIIPGIELFGAACKGRTVTLKASGFIGTATYLWYEGIFPGILKSTTNIPTYSFITNTDSAKFYVIVDGVACKSNPSTVLQIKINEIPQVKVQDSVLNVCEGQPIILNGILTNTFQSGLWTGPNGFRSTTLISTVTSSGTVINSGTYSFISESNGCKSDSVTTKVVVAPRPSKPQISGDSLFCLGSTITLRLTGDADSILWMKNGSIILRGKTKNLTLERVQSSDNGSYTALLKNGNCISETSNPIVISISTQTSISIINPGEVCVGDSVTLRVTSLAGFTYSWSGPNGFNANGANIAIKALSGTYSVLAMNSSLCQSTDTIEIKAKPRPTIISLVSDFNPCTEPNKDILLTANIDLPFATSMFNWTGPNGFVSSVQAPKVVNTGSSIFGIYRLMVNSNGCSSEPKSIDIRSAPILTKLVIKGPNLVCEGDSIVLSGQRGYTNYEWTTPNGVITTADSTFTIRNFTQPSAGSYSLKATAGQCVPPSSEVFQIAIISRPATPIIQGKTAVCLGDSIILNANVSDTTLIYLWNIPKNKVISSKSRLAVIDLPNELNGVYRLQTQKGSCRSEFSNSINVSYKASIPIPKLGTTLISICDRGNSEVKLCLQNIPRDTSLTYFLIQLPSNKTLLSTKDSCLNFLSSEIESGSNKIRLTSKKDECFSDSFDDALFSSVKEPKIKAEIVANTIGVCNKDQKVILFNKTSIDTVFYVWKVFNRGNTLANLPDNAIEVSNFLPGNNIITLSLNFNICREISSDTINLFLGTKPKAIADTFKVKVNETMPFNVLVNDSVGPFPVIKFATPQSSIIEYDFVRKSYLFTPERNFLGRVKVDYELCFGSCRDFCTNSSVVFEVEGTIDCIYPTIITPNGDGINDIFEVPCISLAGQNESSFKVFNIYGDQIFGAEPYLNNWNGTYNGANLPEGTYYYIFQLDKQAELKKSFLIIQR